MTRFFRSTPWVLDNYSWTTAVYTHDRADGVCFGHPTQEQVDAFPPAVTEIDVITFQNLFNTIRANAQPPAPGPDPLFVQLKQLMDAPQGNWTLNQTEAAVRLVVQILRRHNSIVQDQ